MTQNGSLLYKDEVQVTDDITILIPKVGEVIDREEEYYAEVSMLSAMPADYMVQLDDIGIRYDEINEYELFFILFNSIRENDTGMVFKDLDLNRFEPAVHRESGQPVLYDEVDDIVIDRVVHTKIADLLRRIHRLEKNEKMPGNEEARKYLIERARKKAKRDRRRRRQSQLEQLITAMVNTEEFKYDYVGTRELTIYQFNESVRQIQHKVDYNNIMHGVYAGTVDPKSISQDSLNWLIHK